VNPMTEEHPTAAPALPAVAPAERAGDASPSEPAAIERVCIICSKGTLDGAYPALVLANAARMSGIEATLFFTFWGLDVITEKTVDHLQVATVGNPAMHLPTIVGGLPGMAAMATAMMKKEMERLDLPPVREMLQILSDSGARLYGCRLAMDMFHRSRADLVPQVEDVITAMDFYDKAAGAQVIFV
jgi:peroxiredoxin family protein